MIFIHADISGKILAYREIPEEDEAIIALYRETERLVGADAAYPHETHWVNDSDEVVPRPAMPLSVSGTTITGIPSGSVLALGEQTFEVDDGEADITGYSGAVKITCWPYLDAEVVI